MKPNRTIWLLCLIGLAGCGGSSGKGFLSIKVIDPLQPAGLKTGTILPPPLVVDSFTIFISGPGIDPPVEQAVSGTAKSVEITGLPAGSGRVILIEARNSRGQVIRRREIPNVVIEAGVVSPIEAKLLTVPIFDNLSDGNLLPATRVVLNGFGEPGARLEISDRYRDDEGSLKDISGGFSVIPSLSLGDFALNPGSLPPGPHTFTVRDRETGESSSVQVVLVLPGQRPGWTLSAGAGDRGSSLAPSPFGGGRANYPALVRHRRKIRIDAVQNEGGEK